MECLAKPHEYWLVRLGRGDTWDVILIATDPSEFYQCGDESPFESRLVKEWIRKVEP